MIPTDKVQSDALLEIDFLAGTSIERAAEQACELSRRLQVNIKFDFNGVQVLVAPHLQPEFIQQRWREDMNRVAAQLFPEKHKP